MTGVLTPTLEAELAVVIGPLNSFLTALQAPNVNTQTVVQDYTSLQLAELQNAPLIESIGIGGVAAAAQTKLNARIASLTAPAATPSPIPSPAPAPTPAPAA
jgi:hypothetical protein